MLWLIFGLILAAAAVATFIGSKRNRKEAQKERPDFGNGYDSVKQKERWQDERDTNRAVARGATVVGTVLTIIALLFLLLSVGYTQGVGQAKVIIDFGGKIAGQDVSAGVGFKAPWQNVKNWDLFAQEAVYAGGKDGAPDYTGGKVNGQQVTASVKGGAQTDYDLAISYNLDGSKVSDLYKTYRDQERFTRQAVEPVLLAVARDIPTKYTPAEFRGEKRGEATLRIEEELNKRLGTHGIKVTLVTIQNIRYAEDVEASIKAVEVAQQKEAQAQADLRATEVSAQAQVVEANAQAEAAIAKAAGEAEANRLLEQSLTPNVLESKRLDTLKSIGDKGNMVIVPEGSTPFVQVNP